MTTEEKRQAISDRCTGRCGDCPLYKVINPNVENCYTADDDPDVDAKIERNYAILFGDSEPTTAEKRQVLCDFCNNHTCHHRPFKTACPFGENEYCGEYNMEDAPDDIIDAWYDLFFVVKPEPDPQPTGTTDTVNHPKHYGREGAMECIDEMVLVFGVEATMHFCLLNAWKYRYRAADKGGEEDMQKSDWYMAKYAELKGVV